MVEVKLASSPVGSGGALLQQPDKEARGRQNRPRAQGARALKRTVKKRKEE